MKNASASTDRTGGIRNHNVDHNSISDRDRGGDPALRVLTDSFANREKASDRGER